jgi:hypothetical protein
MQQFQLGININPEKVRKKKSVVNSKYLMRLDTVAVLVMLPTYQSDDCILDTFKSYWILLLNRTGNWIFNKSR